MSTGPVGPSPASRIARAGEHCICIGVFHRLDCPRFASPAAPVIEVLRQAADSPWLEVPE